MSKPKKKLTNEELSKHFKNPFELVNHAIGVAKHLVQAGHDLTDAGDRNTASVILKRVLKERESEELLGHEKASTTEDKDLPDPMLQAV